MMERRKMFEVKEEEGGDGVLLRVAGVRGEWKGCFLLFKKLGFT